MTPGSAHQNVGRSATRRGYPNATTLSFAAAIALLLGGLGLSYYNFKRLLGATRASHHTQEVVAELREVQMWLVDAESATRGFALSGEESLLAPYTHARDALPGDLARLRSLVSDNPRQEDRIRRLGELARRKMARVDEVIAARRRGGLDEVRRVPAPFSGARIMGEIRALAASVEAEEDRLQVTRDRRVETDAALLNRTLLALAALALALVALARRALDRANAERERAEAHRAKTEEEVRQANRFLDAIIENIPSMIFVKSAKELAFVRFNRAGEELLGLKRSELQGKTDFDFFPRGEAEFFVEKDRQTLADGALIDIPEEPIETKSGRRWLHTRKVPVADDEGTPAFLLGISDDITDLKKADEARREYETSILTAKTEAEAASRELEAFSYSVSHDLRAPLRSIDGFSQALAEDYADLLDTQGKDYLRRVRSAAQRMSQLIDDLLNLSRVTRAELRRESVDLSSLAREVEVELRQQFPDRAVTFNIEDGLVVDGDPRLLRVVLDNLLGNAWKFTSKRPASIIRFGRAEVDGASQFFVGDDGAGFDPAYSSKLFGAFQRLHATSEYEGTGIGLATVQRIIQRHGGRVWGEGAPDRGATFYFTIGTAHPTVRPEKMP